MDAHELQASIRAGDYDRFVVHVGGRRLVVASAGLRAHAQGDSSVVEIRPRAAAPGVDLGEWLAFTRVCFGQKNKTLGAIFKQKRMVMDLFSRSRRAVQGEGSAGGVGLAALDGDGDEDINDDGAAGFSDEELGTFKERIAGALESAELAGKRPSKLSNDELLRLLRLFNERGVRFQ